MAVKNYSIKNKSKNQITFTLEMEERLAAQWAGYTWQVYSALPGSDRWIDPEIGGDSKCSVLVAYRHAKAIESILRDE